MGEFKFVVKTTTTTNTNKTWLQHGDDNYYVTTFTYKLANKTKYWFYSLIDSTTKRVKIPISLRSLAPKTKKKTKTKQKRFK